MQIEDMQGFNKLEHGPQGVRLGTNLGDLLCGEYSMEGLDHQGRCTLIHDLAMMMDTAKGLGWHEHTSDWDWRVEVQTADGLIHPNDDGARDDEGFAEARSDEFELDWPEGEDLPTICVDHAKIRTMNMIYDDGTTTADGLTYKSTTLHINVDDVISITLWYDT